MSPYEYVPPFRSADGNSYSFVYYYTVEWELKKEKGFYFSEIIKKI